MPNFERLAYFFFIDGTGPYVGQVVVSHEALYFAAALRPFSLKTLFSGGLGKRLAVENNPLQTPLSDLPDEVLNDPSWPIPTTDGQVCVFHRDSATRVQSSFFRGLRVSDTAHSAVIRSGMIERFKMLKILRKFEWTLS